MDPVASMIVASAERMLGLSEALLKDVPADKFARFASPGGKAVEANHPAFIYGHLSIYPSWILSMIGQDASAVSPADDYKALFEHGKPCLDDADGSIYPAQAEIVDLFNRSYRAAIDAVGGMSAAQLQGPSGIEGDFGVMFPRAGDIANFMLVGHTMMHLGQMSTWRRAIGLGSAM